MASGVRAVWVQHSRGPHFLRDRQGWRSRRAASDRRRGEQEGRQEAAPGRGGGIWQDRGERGTEGLPRREGAHRGGAGAGDEGGARDVERAAATEDAGKGVRRRVEQAV